MFSFWGCPPLPPWPLDAPTVRGAPCPGAEGGPRPLYLKIWSYCYGNNVSLFEFHVVMIFLGSLLESAPPLGPWPPPR